MIALDTTSSTAPQLPPPSDTVQLLRVIDNVGSAQGGDSIRLLCTGIDAAHLSSASVTVGGKPATNLSIYQGSWGPYLSNETILVTVTPPGAAGLADVVLSANGSSDRAPKAFQYAADRTIFPFATSPNFLLYDSIRNRLYAGHKDRVEVIDIAG